MRAAVGSTAIEPTVAMGDEYTRQTLELSDSIESWAKLGAYDPQRPKAAQVLPSVSPPHAAAQLGLSLTSLVAAAVRP